MIRGIGCKEPFGAVAHIEGQHIEGSNFRVCAGAHRRHFAMLPIQCGKDELIANLIGFFWQISFPTRLAALLHCLTFRAYSLIDEYGNKLSSGQRSFEFKKMIM